MKILLLAPPAAWCALAPVAAAISSLWLPSAFAQSPSAPQTIVVTGSREPSPLDSQIGDLVVIDAATIQASTADSVEDLLRRQAGVQVSRSGGPGASAGVFIRGSSSSNTLVLVDGVRIGSSTLGQTDFASLNLAQIDHIEILRGPGSSLYGADAVGGVVQIFTRRGQGAPRVTGHLAIGSDSSREGDLGVSGASGAFDYALSASHEASDGVSVLRPADQFGNYNPDADGFRRSTGQVNLGFTPAEGHRIGLNLVEGRLNSQYDGSEFAPPDYAQDPSPDFRNRLDTRVAAVDYRGKLSPQWTLSTRLSSNRDELEAGGNLIDRFLTRREQLSAQAAWMPASGQQVVMAAEHLRERATSSSFIADVKRDNSALVLGYTGALAGGIGVQGDLRHDNNSIYGNNTTGRLGASWGFAPNLRARILAGTTFRAPSFNDLYFPGFGVSTVQPEKGRSVELGLEWRAAGTQVAATLYRNSVRDLIGYEPDAALCPNDPAYSFGCARNINRARLQGATLSASHQMGDWQVAAVLDWLDAHDLATGARLVRRAAHQQSLDVDYQLGDWTLGAALLAVGARPEGDRQLSAYTTVDLRAHWRFSPGWRLEAKVLNVADRDVEPARDYQQPGRQAWIGIRYGGL